MDGTRLSFQAQSADVVYSRPSGKRAAGTSRPRRKIFFLVDSLNVGGTETQAVELATRLDSENYEVTLGCLRARGPLLEKLAGSAASVREFFPKGGVDSIHGLIQLLRLAIFLRRERVQIVHTHDLYSNLMGIPAAVIARVPVIISSRRDLGHLDWYRNGRRVWLRRLQSLSTIILTNANPIRETLITDDGFAPTKVRTIHNGVDVEKFSQQSGERSWLVPAESASEQRKEKWIVLVGNMHSDVKGHPWLIAAAPAIVAEFPETRFILVGDGARRNDFALQVDGLGLTEKFHFIGVRPDVPRILGCCDVAVLPSRAEGLPNAVLEYMAARLPTIASRVGGNTEIIRDGISGLLIPPEDSSALANAVLALLRDPDLGERLGQEGRRFVASQFSFERMVQNADRLYTELLHSRGVE